MTKKELRAKWLERSRQYEQEAEEALAKVEDETNGKMEWLLMEQWNTLIALQQAALRMVELASW